ncbi:major capsid protein [uncultured Mediterranean phage uvDeep-CGR2-KM21-C368]|nr:major capsid protein [uncultured Mediterranean phage uvDeep-CGR2-KM21-C368]
MSSSIDTAFIKQFEAEVHMAYQRKGSSIRGTVRTINNVTGSTAQFHKSGSGTAVTKSRHGEIATMNATHDVAPVTLSDYYAADYVDKLDELKTNLDERGVIANNSAWALGRQTDTQLETALDSTSNQVGVQYGTSPAANTNMTLAKAKRVWELFGTNDVPDDGQRYWVVGHSQWSSLLSIDQFSNSDYIPESETVWSDGRTAKQWLGFKWYAFSGVTISSGTIRKTYAYHSSAVGHAIQKDVSTEINYVPEKAAHLITSLMAMGATLIDADGVQEVLCDEA